MASAAYDRGLTLAPFRRIYGEFPEAVLLADNMFTVPEHEPDTGGREDSGVQAPQVISMINRVQFEAALARWLNDSMFDSLPDRMKRHESFAMLVAEGDRAVPLIAAELRKRPSFLFLALEEITGEDPVPAEAQGDLKATISAWLAWLRR